MMKPERHPAFGLQAFADATHTVKVARSRLPGNPFGFTEIGPEHRHVAPEMDRGRHDDDDLRARLSHGRHPFLERRQTVLRHCPSARQNLPTETQAVFGGAYRPMDGTYPRRIGSFRCVPPLTLTGLIREALLRFSCSVVPSKPHDYLLTLHHFRASE